MSNSMMRLSIMHISQAKAACGPLTGILVTSAWPYIGKIVEERPIVKIPLWFLNYEGAL